MAEHIEKDDYIALSGYAKSKGLSVPKNFDIDSLVLTLKSENATNVKVNGWKFKESVLDEYVPKLGFKKTVKRPTEPDELVSYTTLVDDQEVYIFASVKPSTEKAFIRAIEDSIEETITKVKDIVYNENPDSLISSISIMGKLLNGELFADRIDIDKKFNGKFYISTVREFEYQVMQKLIGK